VGGGGGEGRGNYSGREKFKYKTPHSFKGILRPSGKKRKGTDLEIFEGLTTHPECPRRALDPREKGHLERREFAKKKRIDKTVVPIEEKGFPYNGRGKYSPRNDGNSNGR